MDAKWQYHTKNLFLIACGVLYVIVRRIMIVEVFISFRALPESAYDSSSFHPSHLARTKMRMKKTGRKKERSRISNTEQSAGVRSGGCLEGGVQRLARGGRTTSVKWDSIYI